jgi:hypothetical protein
MLILGCLAKQIRAVNPVPSSSAGKTADYLRVFGALRRASLA